MTNSPVRNDVLLVLTRNCRRLFKRADVAEGRLGKTMEIGSIRAMTALALQLAYASHRVSSKASTQLEQELAARENTQAVYLSCDLIDSAELMLANLRSFSPAKADGAENGAELLRFDDADDFVKEALARRAIVSTLKQLNMFLASEEQAFIDASALRFLKTFAVLAQEEHADIESVTLQAFRTITF